MPSQTLNVASPEDLNLLVVSEEPDTVLVMFMQHFEPIIFQVVVRFLKSHNCKDPEDHSRDISQNAFIVVYQEFCAYYASLKAPNFINPKGWISSIAIRHAFKHFARECRKKEVEVESFNNDVNTLDEGLSGILFKFIHEESKKHSRAGSTQASLEAKDTLNSIEQYISSLSSMKKAAFILRMNGNSSKEIGEALSMSETAARKMVNRLFFTINQKFNI